MRRVRSYVMKRTIALIAAALLGGAIAPAAIAPQSAIAAQSCSNTPRTSYFGNIESVKPSYFLLATNSSVGKVHVYTHGAHINYNGQSLRPGVYAGVYGCEWESRDAVIAENITLSANQASFPGNGFPGSRTSTDRTVEGRIDQVRSDRVLIDSGSGHGDTWVVTNDAPQLRNGDLIRATGSFSSADRSFVASNVQVLSGSTNQGTSNASTIEGRIDTVQQGRVLIDSNGGHGNVWVVTNMSGLKTGELIRATGHFNSADRSFVATNITVEAM